jgi:hypothetical protein
LDWLVWRYTWAKNSLPESLPRINEIGLNGEVVGFALVLAVATGLLCGLTPVSGTGSMLGVPHYR